MSKRLLKHYAKKIKKLKINKIHYAILSLPLVTSQNLKLRSDCRFLSENSL